MYHCLINKTAAYRNFQNISIITIEAYSISQYPLTSCHFPKPNIHFPFEVRAINHQGENWQLLLKKN
jgi:hypothetical protein